MNARVELPERLILFDGVCAVCDQGMAWIMERDTERRFHYAPLQGETAASVRAQHPELPHDLDSIIVVERTPGGSRVHWHSDGLLAIARGLPAPWRWAGVLSVVPRGLRDAGYRLFAAWRYRIFGTIDACRLMTEDEAARMLP